MPSTNPLSARTRIQSSPNPGEMPGVGQARHLSSVGRAKTRTVELAAPLELRVHRELERRRDVVNRRDAELGEMLLRGARLAQTLVEGLGRDCAARTRTSAESETRPVARPSTHSSPGTGRAHESPARSSARPFASHALRSQRLSRIGVVPLTESMIERSGRIVRAARWCRRTPPVLFADQSSYAPQSPPVSHAPGLMRADRGLHARRERRRRADVEQVRADEQRAGLAEVRVIVDESRRDEPSAGVDDARARRCDARSTSALVPTASSRSPRTASACARGRARVAGPDARVAEDEVGVLREQGGGDERAENDAR